jgi:hypothetical protein
MKWDCGDAFSVMVTPRHLAANSAGVSVGWTNDSFPFPIRCLGYCTGVAFT